MTTNQYENGNMDIAMSVTSRYLPYEVASASHKSFPGGEAMFQFYNTNIGLRAVHFGEDLRASENMEYMSQGSTNNALCFTGPHRKFDPINKVYTQLIPGMGHWGPDARPGDVSFFPRWNARTPSADHSRMQLLYRPVTSCFRRRAGAAASRST
jgi:hypothetical protein